MNEHTDKQFEIDKRYLRMAAVWAENSYCKRRQVGALIVKEQMIISDGYNGTPSGFENVCEDEHNVTKPYGSMQRRMRSPKWPLLPTVARVRPSMSPRHLASSVRS